jgi:hypothetical protein
LIPWWWYSMEVTPSKRKPSNLGGGGLKAMVSSWLCGYCPLELHAPVLPACAAHQGLLPVPEFGRCLSTASTTHLPPPPHLIRPPAPSQQPSTHPHLISSIQYRRLDSRYRSVSKPL